MLRAVTTILTIFLVALLGSAQARADVAPTAACHTKAEVIAYFEGAREGMSHQIYTGADSEAIKAGLVKATSRDLSGEREFVVFRHPKIPSVLIVGFVGGCYEGQQEVPPRILDLWLSTSGASE